MDPQNCYDLQQTHEVDQMMGGFDGNITEFLEKAASTFITPTNSDIPDEIDWRTKGAVTPVRDQRICRASYAFSVVSNYKQCSDLDQGICRASYAFSVVSNYKQCSDLDQGICRASYAFSVVSNYKQCSDLDQGICRASYAFIVVSNYKQCSDLDQIGRASCRERV